jgi:hypothetical protein
MINKIIFAGFLFELFLLGTSIKEKVNQREEKTLVEVFDFGSARLQRRETSIFN